MTFTDAVASSLIDTVTKRGTSTTYFTLLSADVQYNDTMATFAECTDAGLSRQTAAWTVPARVGTDTTVPLSSSTNAGVTFGPLTAAMANPATYLALVTAQTGTGGTVLRTWPLGTQWQGAVGDTYAVPAGTPVVSVR